MRKPPLKKVKRVAKKMAREMATKARIPAMRIPATKARIPAMRAMVMETRVKILAIVMGVERGSFKQP
jgi:hypothetical protein